MDLTTVTPLVLTHDEAPNIRRTMAGLTWASRIVVVDSGSTDGTLDLLSEYPNVVVAHRRFDSFAGQCNFGLGLTETEWVLSLDADYVLPAGLTEELARLEPAQEIAGYRVRFRYCVGGNALRTALYPPRTVLYRREHARYIDDGHGHRVEVRGDIRDLRNRIAHDDRKPISRWLDNQRMYARQEADKLMAADKRELTLADRLRRLGVAPFLMPLYCLIARGLILDGRAGWQYTLERTYAEILLALELAERDQTLDRPGDGKTA